MTTIKSNPKSCWFVLLLYAVLALALLSPLASNEQMPSGGDFQNHAGAIVQAGMGLKEGQFPLRVAPWEHHGLRYAEFQFYAPLPYTLAGAVYDVITPKNPYRALKMMLWLALVLGGAYIYRVTRAITAYSPAAILAGFAYMAAPYFLININARGAMAEAFAQGLIPVVLYYTYQLYQKEKLRYLCLSAMAWSALSMTHIISFINTSIFIGLFFFFLCVKDSPKKLFWLALAYFVGVLLSLWFFMPIKLLVHLLPISGDFTAPSVTNNLTSLLTLFAITPAGPNQPGTYANLLTLPFYPAIGLPMMMGVGVIIYLLYRQEWFLDVSVEKMIKPLLGLFLFALFLTWSPFNFWKHLPGIFSVTQFSYRFLSQIMWMGALLLAISIRQIFQDKSPGIVLIVGLWLIAISSSGWLTADYVYASFAKKMVDVPTIGYAKNDYLLQQTLFENKLDKKALAPLCELKKATIFCAISNPDMQTVLLPVLYYPELLRITLDGHVIAYQAMNAGKYLLATINAPAGEHELTATFVGCRWANWVSGVMWVAILFLFVVGMKKKHE